MEFKIKRDFIPIFLFDVLLILIAACSAIFFANFGDPNYTSWFIIVLIVDFVIFAIYNSTVIFAKCTITEDKLIYRRAFLRYSIPLDKIAKVTKSKNLHPSLSLSTNKIRILVVGETGRQCVYYISVQDTDKLINVLKPNPELKKIKDEIPAPLTEMEIKEEEKPEVKETKEEVVATPKTTTKTATTKKPATKTSTAKSATDGAKKTTTTKKATSTSKKEN